MPKRDQNQTKILSENLILLINQYVVKELFYGRLKQKHLLNCSFLTVSLTHTDGFSTWTTINHWTINNWAFHFTCHLIDGPYLTDCSVVREIACNRALLLLSIYHPVHWEETQFASIIRPLNGKYVDVWQQSFYGQFNYCGNFLSRPLLLT